MKNSCCVFVPEILLPQATADMSKWAVIACDQHTSDPAYWQELEEYVKDAPSALRLTLPEIYLSDDCSDRIAAIARSMRAYREKGIFRKLDKGFVLVERSTPFSPARFGLVLAVDLEAYSYEAGAKAQIKATEATIVERIPPRLKIRESASIEFPHVMLLYDDREDSVLGALKARRDSLDFPRSLTRTASCSWWETATILSRPQRRLGKRSKRGYPKRNKKIIPRVLRSRKRSIFMTTGSFLKPFTA